MSEPFGTQTLANYVLVPASHLVDGPRDVLERYRDWTIERVEAAAAHAFGIPLGPFNVACSTDFAFPSNVVAVRVDRRYFVRLNPNPMPQFVLFPRLDRVLVWLDRRVAARKAHRWNKGDRILVNAYRVLRAMSIAGAIAGTVGTATSWLLGNPGTASLALSAGLCIVAIPTTTGAINWLTDPDNAVVRTDADFARTHPITVNPNDPPSAA